MMNEEIEKTMRFILEQQAKHAATQQFILEQQTGYEARQQQVEEQQARVTATQQFILEQQAGYEARQQQVEERASRLETNMAEMARSQTHLNEVVAAMLDTHRLTEEKLDAFIGILERYITEDRNGKANNGDATQQ